MDETEFVPLTEEAPSRLITIHEEAHFNPDYILWLEARLAELTAGCKMPSGGWGDRATCIHEARLAEAEDALIAVRQDRDEWKERADVDADRLVEAERERDERLTKESGRALIEDAKRWSDAYAKARDEAAGLREVLVELHTATYGLVALPERVTELVRAALAAEEAKPRCDAQIEGERCRLEAGHYGRHDYEMTMER